MVNCFLFRNVFWFFIYLSGHCFYEGVVSDADCPCSNAPNIMTRIEPMAGGTDTASHLNPCDKKDDFRYITAIS